MPGEVARKLHEQVTVEHEKGARFHGDARCGASAAVDQRYLAEHFAFSHDAEHGVSTLAITSGDLEPPRHDREQRGRRLTLSDDYGAGGEAANLSQRADFGQVLFGQTLEEWN